ncbi:MAG TPA: hypothetical protein VMV51_11735 [Gemmatimonadaceae bacterium]|nr:hypothetical protein [Gemmatimonadaceae bacterium]
MRTLKTVLWIGGGSALLAMPALGQGRPLPLQRPPSRAQQGTGGAATPPAPPASPAPTVSARVSPRERYSYGDEPVLYTEFPTTVASDGKVYANFGFGYELVPQQCSAQRVAASAGSTNPPGYTRPAYTPPTQGQPTYGQPVVVPPATNGQRRAYDGARSNQGAQRATGACWSRGDDGRVVVRR